MSCRRKGPSRAGRGRSPAGAGCSAVAVFLVPLSAAVGLAVYLPAVYRASTVVLVDRQQVPEAFVRSTVTSGLETRLQTISQEILKRGRLEELIRALRSLPGAPRFPIDGGGDGANAAGHPDRAAYRPGRPGRGDRRVYRELHGAGSGDRRRGGEHPRVLLPDREHPRARAGGVGDRRLPPESSSRR